MASLTDWLTDWLADSMTDWKYRRHQIESNSHKLSQLLLFVVYSQCGCHMDRQYPKWGEWRSRREKSPYVIYTLLHSFSQTFAHIHIHTCCLFNPLGKREDIDYRSTTVLTSYRTDWFRLSVCIFSHSDSISMRARERETYLLIFN